MKLPALPWCVLTGTFFEGNDPEDTAYAVHAANAYPKLVDALKAANQFLHDNAPEGDATLAQTSALLRELGELP